MGRDSKPQGNHGYRVARLGTRGRPVIIIDTRVLRRLTARGLGPHAIARILSEKTGIPISGMTVWRRLRQLGESSARYPGKS